MPIVDSHHHFLDHSKRTYDRGVTFSGMTKNFLPAELEPLLRAAEVSQTVLVQAHPSKEESLWLLDIADENSFVGGVVVWADLSSPDVGQQIAAMATHPKVKGVRAMAQIESDNNWFLRKDVDEGLTAVEERGLVYDLLIRPRHMPSVPEIARRHPRLRIVVDHMAKPFIAAGQSEPWGTLMRSIAACSNVYCKVSGLVTEDEVDNVQPAHAKPFVETVVRLFGFDRIMFGSDWPTSTQAMDYSATLDFARACVGSSSESQLEKFFADTARDFYSLA